MVKIITGVSWTINPRRIPDQGMELKTVTITGSESKDLGSENAGKKEDDIGSPLAKMYTNWGGSADSVTTRGSPSRDGKEGFVFLRDVRNKKEGGGKGHAGKSRGRKRGKG